jgi:hypothetical protein
MPKVGGPGAQRVRRLDQPHVVGLHRAQPVPVAPVEQGDIAGHVGFAAVFLISEMIKMGDGARFSVGHFPVANSSARFPLGLSFLTKERPELREVHDIISATSPGQTPEPFLKTLSYWSFICESLT